MGVGGPFLPHMLMSFLGNEMNGEKVAYSDCGFTRCSSFAGKSKYAVTLNKSARWTLFTIITAALGTREESRIETKTDMSANRYYTKRVFIPSEK
jgi:hypothetical protein